MSKMVRALDRMVLFIKTKHLAGICPFLCAFSSPSKHSHSTDSYHLKELPVASKSDFMPPYIKVTLQEFKTIT